MKTVILLSCMVGIALSVPVPVVQKDPQPIDELPSPVEVEDSNQVQAVRRKRFFGLDVDIYNGGYGGYGGYPGYGYGGFGGYPVYGGYGGYPGYGGGGFGGYPGYGYGGYPGYGGGFGGYPGYGYGGFF